MIGGIMPGVSSVMPTSQDQINARATAQNASRVQAQNAYNASVQNGVQHQKAGAMVPPSTFSPVAQQNMANIYGANQLPDSFDRATIPQTLPQPAAPMGAITDVDQTGMNSLYNQYG